MKKLLGFLAAFGLTSIVGLNIVACQKNNDQEINVSRMVNVEFGKEVIVEIKNLQELKGVKIESANNKVATATFKNDKIEISGPEIDTITITVRCINA